MGSKPKIDNSAQIAATQKAAEDARAQSVQQAQATAAQQSQITARQAAQDAVQAAQSTPVRSAEVQLGTASDANTLRKKTEQQFGTGYNGVSI
jgi:hypothetical protein